MAICKNKNKPKEDQQPPPPKKKKKNPPNKHGDKFVISHIVSAVITCIFSTDIQIFTTIADLIDHSHSIYLKLDRCC